MVSLVSWLAVVSWLAGAGTCSWIYRMGDVMRLLVIDILVSI